MSPATLHRTLPAVPASARRARVLAEEWGADCTTEGREALVLVANELVSNSIRHGPSGGSIELTLDRQGGDAHVEVGDEGERAPIGVVEPYEQGGRGLALVDALASTWGVRTCPTRVWLCLPCFAQGRQQNT